MKRIFAVLLAVVLAVSTMSVTAYAAENPFVDVKPSAYYYDSVMWAVENGITSGVSADRFAPNDFCTRGQFVTFLWKTMGSPEPNSLTNPFSDVKTTDYFYKAVLWAAEQGIASGSGNGAFKPRDICTRAQAVTFLFKAQGGYAISGSCGFTDVKESSYYYNAVIWAAANGITQGVSATEFGPNRNCTRGQLVIFLYKFCHIVPPVHPHNFTVTVVAPTCTRNGYTEHTCMLCGGSYKDNYVDALGHDYTETVVPPTCVEYGYTEYTCTRCGRSYIDNYVASGHDYTETIVPPACEESGYTEHTCTLCGDTFRDNYTDPTGHINLEVRNRIEATTASEGYTGDVYCRDCGALVAAGHVIPKVYIPSDEWADIEDEVISIINERRVALGLNALTKAGSDEINAARTRAYELTINDSHTRPDGSSCYTAYPHPYGAECLLITSYYVSTTDFVDAWQSSPPHWTALTDANVNYIAIGVYSVGGWYCVISHTY